MKVWLQQGAALLGMLTEFMNVWFAESTKWVDATLKVAASESPQNKELIQGWINQWAARANEALTPLTKMMYFDDAQAALDEANAALVARLQKLGLSAPAPADAPAAA